VLAFLFNFIRSLALPTLYFGGILTAIVTIFRKAEWGLLLMVALIPQPNIFYKLYDFPMGQRFLDFLFLAVMIGIFVNKRGFERTGNSLLIFILILVSYLAVWNSSMNFSLPLPLTTANPVLKPWKSYAYMVFTYLLTFNAMKDDENQRKMLVLVMALVLLFVSVRSYRSYTPGGSFLEDSRASGPFWVVGLGSNHFGAFIVYCSAVLLGLIFLDNNRWRKMLFLVIILVGLHPLFFSYSRGAYAAALVVLVFFGLVKKRGLLILVFALIVAWQTLLPSSVVERIKMTKTEGGEVEESAAVRLYLWDNALKLFEEHPVIGTGFGGFAFSMPEEIYWKDTHNYYLKMLCEQGIIGFILLLITFFASFRSGWRLLKVGRNGFERGLGLGFAGCVVACVITNLFGDRWSYYELGTYFWVFWGLVDRGILSSKESLDVKNIQKEGTVIE
jgi:putative inorganic carbon (HCO3(-)) transporter